mgnify:CR=1 FL=1|jgi:hypothetical protein
MAVVVAAGTGALGAGGHPVPTEADLKAYDALLTDAKTMKIHAVSDSKNHWRTFRVDVDDARHALSIHVNFDRIKEKRGAYIKDVGQDDPLGQFVADVVLGDGSDGRVVLTVHRSQTGYPAQCMDRGEEATFAGASVPYGALNVGFSWGELCKMKEYAYTVERADGGSRLAATAALNAATCRRAWCEACCILPTACFGPMCCWACWSPPDVHYELQGADQAPLGGATYVEPKYTCIARDVCGYNTPSGAVVQFGTAPLKARRDIVIALAGSIGQMSVPSMRSTA